jgi:[NiFe] hydrogenase diaphorase moiety small subunit
VLVALGECAIWGGLPAMRNTIPLEACLAESYLNSMTGDPGNKIPFHTDIPILSDKVYGIKDAVMIDYYIPGCPPRPKLIWSMVKAILLGTKEMIPYEELKYD